MPWPGPTCGARPRWRCTCAPTSPCSGCCTATTARRRASSTERSWVQVTTSSPAALRRGGLWPTSTSSPAITSGAARRRGGGGGGAEAGDPSTAARALNVIGMVDLYAFPESARPALAEAVEPGPDHIRRVVPLGRALPARYHVDLARSVRRGRAVPRRGVRDRSTTRRSGTSRGTARLASSGALRRGDLADADRWYERGRGAAGRSGIPPSSPPSPRSRSRAWCCAVGCRSVGARRPCGRRPRVAGVRRPAARAVGAARRQQHRPQRRAA